MRPYTRRGDDGTTGLHGGGRVAKTSLVVEVLGSVDEAQAALGLARAETVRGGELDTLLLELERQLWVLMAEVANAPERRGELLAGSTRVDRDMVVALESRIDAVCAGLDLERGFVAPGGTRLSAALDLARTVVRRAERHAAGLELGPSSVVPYLNRLSDLCWALARAAEGEHVRMEDLEKATPATPAGEEGSQP